ncbi:MAG: translation initiation factor IF-2 [Anaerovoracaceae bacterium]|nr:translation initiation factor IF-2 [Anaerovoracaceae bacterium]
MATDNKETKIVKAAQKKTESQQDEQPRVTVKAAVKPQSRPQKQTRTPAAASDRPTQKPPVGKPVANRELEGRPRPPMGKPVIPKEFAERDKKKDEAAMPATPAASATPAAPAVEKPAEKAVPAAEKPAPAPEKAAPAAEKPAAPAAEKSAPAAEKPAEKPAAETRQQTGDRPARPVRQNEGRDGRDSRDNRQARDGRPGDRDGRGPRNDRDSRGPRNDRDGRPNRDGRPGDRDSRGPRNDRDNRGPRNDRDGRGDRPQGGNRPQGGGRPRQERPADKPKLETKPTQRKPEKLAHHDKERDKFAKLENGGKKNKQKIQERSLEKQAKPKKHNKPKPVVEEVEEMEPLPEGTTVITVPITVAGFCEQVGISTSQVIMALMKLGIMANINQNIDEDTVMILADELKISVAVGKVESEEEEEGLELFEDREEDLKPRPPIITVMGHVDHGKTSLLDAIRKTNVTSTESGGITQHIGASEVSINGQKIVFLDTPGHEAFTAMRARGAHVTDIAVLVVAADDGVMPQTVESISHAKAAGVPIIVAINKIDKPGANPDRVKQELTEHGILVEDWGGDVISVPVSAKSGEGIVNLLEMILLQAEVLELRANPNRLAMGSVIEARLDKNKGPVATLLVTNGTLKSGMSVVAGTCSGRIRLMTNYKGDTIKKAGPATAVEILGLTDVPEAGDEFNAVKEDKLAREIAENRKAKLREEILARNASTTLEQLFSQIQEGETKDLNLIIKGDVQGSVGAIVASLEKLKNENVRVKIIHTGVGTVTESDVMLAGTTGSIIIGFNVRPTTAVQTFADRENIQIRLYRVIYDIINDVEDAMKGMLDPEFKEEVLGKAEVRTTFKVPGVGTVAGTYVLEGKMQRNAEVRLVRDGIVIHEGKISSLKRFKDDAKEVNQGYECGLGIENYNDVKEGDIIECFHMVEIERK